MSLVLVFSDECSEYQRASAERMNETIDTLNEGAPDDKKRSHIPSSSPLAVTDQGDIVAYSTSFSDLTDIQGTCFMQNFGESAQPVAIVSEMRTVRSSSGGFVNQERWSDWGVTMEDVEAACNGHP